MTDKPLTFPATIEVEMAENKHSFPALVRPVIVRSMGRDLGQYMAHHPDHPTHQHVPEDQPVKGKPWVSAVAMDDTPFSHLPGDIRAAVARLAFAERHRAFMQIAEQARADAALFARCPHD